jgi:hypothetical protein
MDDPSQFMRKRTGLLRKLVIDGHLSVEERQVLGKVTRQEVSELVKMLLLSDGTFPKRHEGRAVYEGARLVRVADGVEVLWERSNPCEPFTIAERRTEMFRQIDAAIQRFIDSEWRSGIDGIVLN